MKQVRQIAENKGDERNPILSAFMLVLSVYVLVVVFVDSFFISDPEIKAVLRIIDFSVCMVFLLDFFVSFYRAPNKLAYMKWGWLDLISSIPAIDPFRWARLSKIIRIIRFFRTIKSIRLLATTVLNSKTQSLSLVVLMTTFIAFTICTGLILEFERGTGSSIQTANDAFWWAFLNLMNAKTSIDQAQSTAGAITTIVLNKVGLLIFAYFNAMIVAWLINKRQLVAD